MTADPRLDGYLCRYRFWLSDLQAGGDGLSLWDGGQRGRGRLHHLQGLLGDLNHLRVRFRLDHLDLLHHRWLPGALNDQQVVTCLYSQRQERLSHDVHGHVITTVATRGQQSRVYEWLAAASQSSAQSSRSMWSDVPG